MSFYPVHENHKRTQDYFYKHMALDMKACKAEWPSFILRPAIRAWVISMPLNPVAERIAFICIAQRYLREVRA